MIIMFYDVKVIQTFTKLVTVRVKAKSESEVWIKFNKGKLDKAIMAASNELTEPHHYTHQDNDYDYVYEVVRSEAQHTYQGD